MNIKKFVGLINSARGRVIFLLLIIAIPITLGLIFARSRPSPIPSSIQKNVSYPIYYPDTKLLPAGYKLNLKSIVSGGPGVIIFSVNFAQNRSVVIVEQNMPDSVTLNTFAGDIPLHSAFNTPNGQAILGAYDTDNGLRSVISLPITRGPWVLATAPPDINKLDFQKVIDSLIKN